MYTVTYYERTIGDVNYEISLDERLGVYLIGEKNV